MTSKKSLFLFFLFCSALQVLLFLPLYVTRAEEGTFWPILNSIPESLVTRPNPDLFRWCLELSILLSVYIYLRHRIKSTWPDWAMSLIYFLILLFQAYYFTLWKIYGEIPIFSYDWALFKRVLPVFMKTMHIVPAVFYFLLALIATLLIYIFFKCFQWLHKSMDSVSLKEVFVFLSITFLIPFTLKSVIPHPAESNATKSSIVWLTENMHHTFTGSRVHYLPDTINTTGYQSYAHLPLKSKPNILLIFIEAYGSVLGCVAPYNIEYFKQLNTIENNLANAGWRSASTLSNSTILGGRSWLGFTSLIAGTKIDNHLAYEKMINRFTPFPHLINTLNAHGYTTYRLNTMSNYGEDFKQIDSVAGNYFNINSTWTKFNTIPYQGYRYDYFGGIPDQYALNYWSENVLDKNKQPYFLFFITLNTHAPFYLPPPLVTNWKDLDAIKISPHQNVRAESGKPIERYAKEVKYILSTLEQFIVNKADSNTMIILIGDHQPAGMEYMIQGKTDLYANPMHIITKDTRWINLFVEYGFQNGMVPKLEKPSLLNHQEIYSFLMQTWAKHDSINEELKIFKNGLPY